MSPKIAFSFLLSGLLTSVFIIQCITGTWNTGIPAANQLLHANVFHLALNIWILFTVTRNTILPLWATICICFALGAIGMAAQPGAVGISAFLFAMLGINWHIYDCRNNRIIIALALIVPIFIPQLAFWPHLIPFISSLFINHLILHIYGKKKKEETA